MLTDTRWQFMARRKSKNRISPASTPRPLDGRHRREPVELIERDLYVKPVSTVKHKHDLKPVEDLRHERNEDRYKTFRTVSGRPARIQTRPQGEVRKSWLHTPLHNYFQEPEKVVACIRRDTRARVLHALQKIGRGKRVSRIHRFTEKSRVRCK